jgi:16S rRNA processing protein RimM
VKSEPVDLSGDLVTVGSIATAHGVHGELSVVPLTDVPDRLAAGSLVLLEAPGGEVSPRRIIGVRRHQDRLLIRLEGVPDRTAAEALRGGRLCVREADLPPLPAGQVWRHELPGMAVRSEAGEDLGSVEGVLETGGERLVLAVRGPRGEALVPFVEHFVRSIDRAAGLITVRLIDGLLPETQRDRPSRGDPDTRPTRTRGTRRARGAPP